MESHKKKALSTEYSSWRQSSNNNNNQAAPSRAAKVIIYHLCDRYFNKNLFAREHTFIFTIHTSLWILYFAVERYDDIKYINFGVQSSQISNKK